MTALQAIIGVSWLISAAFLFRLWRGQDHWLLKVAFTVMLAIPVLGPLMYVWIQAMPPPQDRDLQDQRHKRTDVLDRWRDRLEAGGYLRPLRRAGDRKTEKGQRNPP
jgi:hypothetical protein